MKQAVGHNDGGSGVKYLPGKAGDKGSHPSSALLEKAFQPRACISELSHLPGQGKDTARSLPVPGAGYLRVQSPPRCHTIPGAARNTAGSCSPWSWIWPLELEEESPKGDRDATGTVLHCRSSPTEISSEEREGL